MSNGGDAVEIEIQSSTGRIPDEQLDVVEGTEYTFFFCVFKSLQCLLVGKMLVADDINIINTNTVVFINIKGKDHAVGLGGVGGLNDVHLGIQKSFFGIIINDAVFGCINKVVGNHVATHNLYLVADVVGFGFFNTQK